MNKILLLLIPLLCFACSTSTENQETTGASPPERSETYPQLMHEIWEAHGGIEKWQQHEAIAFTITRPPAEATEVHQVNLNSREVLIESDSFRIGMDGSRVWVAPSLKAYDGNPRFYHNLIFYFYGIPFLMEDPGVMLEDIGTRALDGVDYRALKVSFEEGTGDADDDEYFLLVDPSTHQLEWLLYSVTYFVNEKVTNYNALKYGDYSQVGGLQMPGKLTGYEYANDTTGRVRYETIFSDVSFMDSPYPMDKFQKPETGEYVAD